MTVTAYVENISGVRAVYNGNALVLKINSDNSIKRWFTIDLGHNSAQKRKR